MKKMLCLALVLVMAFSFAGSAMAASFTTGGKIGQGAGVYSNGSVEKTTGIGAAATGSATSVSDSTAIFQGTVRKVTDGVNASNTKQFTGKSSFTMTTKYDGYGNALLRTGYKYRLRIAHRSNSPVTEASCSGTWNP